LDLGKDWKQKMGGKDPPLALHHHLGRLILEADKNVRSTNWAGSKRQIDL